MYSVRRTAVLPAVGFPIRVSADQRPFSASSRLIAAVHALHRLLVPRHPPCALDILTVILIDLAEALRKDRSAPVASRTKKRARRLFHPSVTSVCWMTVQFSRSDKEGAARGLRASVSQSSTACRRRCARRPEPADGSRRSGAPAPRPDRST